MSLLCNFHGADFLQSAGSGLLPFSGWTDSEAFACVLRENVEDCTGRLKGQTCKWWTSLMPLFFWPELSHGQPDCQGAGKYSVAPTCGEYW